MELDEAYKKACKRAQAKGRPVPQRDLYYGGAYGYGMYPYMMFGMYPYYMPYGMMPMGAGMVGSCAAGTCGGGVAGGGWQVHDFSLFERSPMLMNLPAVVRVAVASAADVGEEAEWQEAEWQEVVEWQEEWAEGELVAEVSSTFSR